MSAWINRAKAVQNKRNTANASYLYREVFAHSECDKIIDDMSAQAIDKDITLILMRCYD